MLIEWISLKWVIDCPYIHKQTKIWKPNISPFKNYSVSFFTELKSNVEGSRKNREAKVITKKESDEYRKFAPFFPS